MTLRPTNTAQLGNYLPPPECQTLDDRTSQLAWALLDSLNAQIPRDAAYRFTLVEVLALAIHEYAEKRGLSTDEA